MQIAKNFIVTQAQTAQKVNNASQGNSGENFVRASEVKQASPREKSFDRELTKADNAVKENAVKDNSVKDDSFKDNSVKDSSVQNAQEKPENTDALREEVEKATAEMNPTDVKTTQADDTAVKGDATLKDDADVEIKDAPVVVEGEPVDEVDLTKAQEMTAVLMGMSTQTLLPTVEAVEQVGEKAEVEAFAPKIEAVDAIVAIDEEVLSQETENLALDFDAIGLTKTDNKAPIALDSLLPQDADATKQAEENGRLLDMLQGKAPVIAQTVDKTAEKTDEVLVRPAMVDTAVAVELNAAALDTGKAPAEGNAFALNLSGARVNVLNDEHKNDETQSNILEGIPLVVEDKVVDKAQAQMSGDMLNQQKQTQGEEFAVATPNVTTETKPVAKQEANVASNNNTVVTQEAAIASKSNTVDVQEVNAASKNNAVIAQEVTTASTSNTVIAQEANVASKSNTSVTQEAVTASKSNAENVSENISFAGAANFSQPLFDIDAVNGTQSVQKAQPQDFDIPKQIIEQARLIRSAENTQMVIKLRPEHLGELTLKLTVTAEGALNASFHSDNAQVRGIIESSMVQLKQELQEQGIKVDNIDVRTGLADSFLADSQAQQQMYQQQQQQQGMTQAVRNRLADLNAFEESAEAQTVADETVRTQTVSAEGVDYLV